MPPGCTRVTTHEITAHRGHLEIREACVVNTTLYGKDGVGEDIGGGKRLRDQRVKLGESGDISFIES